MAAIQKPFQFGKDICKIFGFDPSTTKSITIKIVPDDLVIVEVETILLEAPADELIIEMNKYEFKVYAKDENTTNTISNPNG